MFHIIFPGCTVPTIHVPPPTFKMAHADQYCTLVMTRDSWLPVFLNFLNLVSQLSESKFINVSLSTWLSRSVCMENSGSWGSFFYRCPSSLGYFHPNVGDFSIIVIHVSKLCASDLLSLQWYFLTTHNIYIFELGIIHLILEKWIRLI